MDPTSYIDGRPVQSPTDDSKPEVNPVFRPGALIEFTGKRGLSVMNDAEYLIFAKFLTISPGTLLLYVDTMVVNNTEYACPMDDDLSEQMKMIDKVLTLTGSIRGGERWSIFHRFIYGDRLIRVIDGTANLQDDFRYAERPNS